MASDISNAGESKVLPQPLVWRRAPVLWGRVIFASLLLVSIVFLLSFGVPLAWGLGHSLGLQRVSCAAS